MMKQVKVQEVAEDENAEKIEIQIKHQFVAFNFMLINSELTEVCRIIYFD